MKKLYLLLICLTLAASLLSSCRIGNGDSGTQGSGGNSTDGGSDNTGGAGTGDTDGGAEPSSDAVFGFGISTTVIRADGEVSEESLNRLVAIKNRVLAQGGASAQITDDLTAAGAHEIVIGDTDREITADAKEILRRAIKRAERDIDDPNERVLAFTVYAEGSSVAVVWSEQGLEKFAIEYFLDNYFNEDSLVLDDGYSRSETMTLLEYLEECDRELYDSEWAAVEAELGEAAADALKAHYSLVDERFYLWLADLYDPLLGGFYYSNAARDNLGFLPDIESTAQVLAFLDNSGMTKTLGGWEYALPGEVIESVVSFTKSLQSERDGYFYHPQWEGLTYTASRLGRDLNWVKEILPTVRLRYIEQYISEGYSQEEAEKLTEKYMPYWDTPNRLAGQYGAPGSDSLAVSSKITLRLGGASAVAASGAVIASSSQSNWTPQLRSVEAWRAYLYGGTVNGVTYEGFDLENNSYPTGNTIVAQADQIKARDAEAAQKGEQTGYVEITKKFFDDGLKAHNGLWEEDVKYNSVNGLMKISSLYNSMGWELKYPDKAIESAITVASFKTPDKDGKEPTDAVDVYNPWVAITAVFNNVEKHNKSLTPDEKEEFSELWHTAIKDNAAAMISGTTAKTAKFAKLDGSYGYHWGAPPVNSQGMPVTVSGIVCGDVNGGCVCSTGIITYMCSGLGIDEIKPSLFYSADMEIFSRHLLGLGEIIKSVESDTDVFVYDFEDGVTGVDYPVVGGAINGGERAVSEHNSPTEQNKLMLTVKDKEVNKGVTTTFEAQGIASKKANCYILEFDICFEEFDKNSYIQLKLGAGENAAYMMTFIGKDNGTVSLGDGSSTTAGVSINKSFGKSIAKGEWHTVRIEYYCGSASEVMIKNYLDGKLIYNSNNYYGKLTGAVVEPNPTYDKAAFYSTYDSVLTYHLDNVTVERAIKEYVSEAVYNPDRIKTFDGLASGALPSGVTAPDSSVVTDPLGGSNKTLKAAGTVTVTTTEHRAPASVFVYESDVYIPEAEDGSLATLYMSGNGVAETVYALTLKAVTDGEEQYALLSPLTKSGETDECLGRAPIGERFKLRIEYYRYQYSEDYNRAQSIVYINGTESGRTDTLYYQYNVGRDYSKLLLKIASGAQIYIDNLIAESDNIVFKNESGKEIANPKNPTFPTGGQGSSTAPDNGYEGRIDFEDSSLGVPKIPGLTTKPNSAEYGNDIEVATDPTDSKNKALLVSTKASARAGNFVKVVPYQRDAEANCYVLEWDMYIASGSVPYYQIKLGDCFMLELRGNTTLRILTKTSNPSDGSGRIETSLSHTLSFDEWHSLRVEYYCGTADTVKVLIYVDGSVYESNHFFGKGINVIGTPTNLYDADNPVNFYSGYDCSADVYFDNIIAEKIVKEYVSPTPEEPEGGEGGEGTQPENPTPDTPTPDEPSAPVIPGGEKGETALGGDGNDLPREGDTTDIWVDPSGGGIIKNASSIPDAPDSPDVPDTPSEPSVPVIPGGESGETVLGDTAPSFKDMTGNWVDPNG